MSKYEYYIKINTIIGFEVNGGYKARVSKSKATSTWDFKKNKTKC